MRTRSPRSSTLGRALLLLLLPAAAAAAGFATGPVRPTPEDFVTLASPGELALSRDGRFAAYTLSRAVRDTAAKPSEDDPSGGWKRTRQVELVDLATHGRRTLTEGDERPSVPRFSPDGATLAFLRKGALWLLPLAGGEARHIETGKLEPEDFQFSPDGLRIAFTATAPRSDAEVERRWRAGGAFEWDEQWRPERLWIVPVGGGAAAAASPESLSVSEFSWSPDGTRLAALTSRSSDPYQVFNFPVPRVLEAAGGRVLATLERRNDSYGNLYANLHWTPDGRSLVCTGLNGGLSNVNALLVWDVSSGRVRDLAPGRDLTFDSIALANGGRDVIASVKARTESRLLRFPLAGGAPQDLGWHGRVLGGELLADAAGRRLAFLSSTPREPQQVTTFEVASRRADVATRFDPQVSTWALGETQVVRWKDAEGVEIEGLLTRPPGGDPAPPLVVMPHGGPDDVTQQSWSAQVQLFASRGYAVLRPNYRGGTGYGFAFYAANRNRFGTIEQMDIESGVDALLARGLADPKRLFFGGWSWGGYLTAWTIGHVQRYRAAVVGAGVNDVTSSYASSDINHGVASQWEYEGDPWRQTDHFDRANPVRYARDMRTPTLILHGQADDRVNFLNGLTLYRALVDVGCEVSFIAYPREPHGFQEPAHLLDRYEAWLHWYDTHGGMDGARP